MVEERESSQSWNLYLAGSGILSVVLELLLGIVFLEQAFSHSQISFHYATTLFSLLTALIIAPLPWFAGRKGCMSLRREMLDAGAGDDSILKLEQTMGSILILCYVALIGCVVALARLS